MQPKELDWCPSISSCSPVNYPLTSPVRFRPNIMLLVFPSTFVGCRIQSGSIVPTSTGRGCGYTTTRVNTDTCGRHSRTTVLFTQIHTIVRIDIVFPATPTPFTIRISVPVAFPIAVAIPVSISAAIALRPDARVSPLEFLATSRFLHGP